MLVHRVLECAALGIAFGGYYLFNGLRLWKEKRTIANRPLSKVRSLAMGEVALAGNVLPIKTIKTPYSDQECVFCSYEVEKWDKNGWKRIEKGMIQSIFYLEDGTGRILINPEKAQFFGRETFQETSESEGVTLYQGVQWWLANRNSVQDQWGMAKYRFTERAVVPNQPIFVEGEVSRTRQLVNGKEQEDNIITHKTKDSLMLLSTYSEESLLSQMGWKAPLQVFGGMVLVLSGLSYFVCLSTLHF